MRITCSTWASRVVAPLLGVFALVSSSQAITIKVPADQPTIQAGINSASDGDVVSVSPGLYTENLDLLGKSIVVTSLAGSELTEISPVITSSPTITINSGEGPGTEVSGFSFDVSTSQSILLGTSTDILIQKNRFSDYAGGDVSIRVDGATNATISHCLFHNNGGISCVGIYSGSALIINNTFDSNARGFFNITLPGAGKAKNNIITNSNVYGIFGSFQELSYNDVWNNRPDYQNGAAPGSGSISTDPLFSDPATLVYSLQLSSPCKDAGDPDPTFNDRDGTRNDMGAFSIDQQLPLPANLALENELLSHVIGHTPTLVWSFFDSVGAQDRYQIEVGTDFDWTVAEMWATGEVVSPSTRVQYSGLPLEDGVTYFLRVRLNNGIAWGGWIELVFRMNSRPTTPVQLNPADGERLNRQFVNLIINNSSDPESDILKYEFELFDDQALSNLIFAARDIDGGVATAETGFIPNLQAETTYWWRARSNDGFEFSDWSATRSVFATGPQTVRVPEDQATIQAAILQANDGDIILVGPGDHIGNFDYGGKTLVIVSVDGPSSTTIIPNSTLAPIVNATNSSGPGSRLEGFTINGFGVSSINVEDAKITIQNCVIRDYTGSNVAIRLGNGSDATIQRNVFYNNQGISSIGQFAGTMNVFNNTFNRNKRGFFTIGGTAHARNNIITNSVDYAVFGQFAELNYNDIWNNNPNYDGGSFPGANSISLDPQYIDEARNDYGLSFESPCVDAGDPSAAFNDPDGTRNDMGAIPTFQVLPVPSGLSILNEDPQRVINHVPIFSWFFVDSIGSQSAFEIEVGIDRDWSVAELWQPGPVSTPDTFAVYAGSELLDGVVYRYRVRLNNGQFWGGWIEKSFRMNSTPATPILSSPVVPDSSSVLKTQLFVKNSPDAESDKITYDFEVYEDAGQTILFHQILNVTEGIDSTGSGIINSLVVGQVYFWRSRSFDGLEYSNWSTLNFFYARGPTSIRAPGRYATIQAALNTATAEDTVIVTSGQYHENLTISEPLIHLVGEDRMTTVISSVITGKHVVDLTDGNANNIVISDLTLRDAVRASGIAIGGSNSATISRCRFIGHRAFATTGGGILSLGSNIIIEDCEFEFNQSDKKGGGIFANGSGISITNCIFHDNASGDGGSGISMVNVSNASITRCLFFNNQTSDDFGGPLYLESSSSIKVYNNTIASNSSAAGTVSGIMMVFCNAIDLRNNIVALNNGGISVAGVSSSGILLEYNDVYSQIAVNYSGVTPGKGSISFDPLFVDQNSDFRLTPSSPCFDAADPNPIFDDPDGTRGNMGSEISTRDLPVASFLNLSGEDPLHVLNHFPTFVWSPVLKSGPQVALEVQVSDTPGVWNPLLLWDESRSATDTSLTYDGLPLLDGETYYLRLKLSDDQVSGDWIEKSFRMNSKPGRPFAISPISGALLPAKPADLVVRNSRDEDNDVLTYSFRLYSDTALTQLVFSIDDVPEGDDSTFSGPTSDLSPKTDFWWRARSTDGFEISDWSSLQSFSTRFPKTLRVPAEFVSIQLAIDSAQDKDTVLVSAGEYIENITFAGKSIKLLSESGADSTFLKPENPAVSTVEVLTGSSPDTELRGFSIIDGGDVVTVFVFSGSSINIAENRFYNNISGLINPLTVIRAIGTCIIERNQFYDNGGINSVWSSSATTIVNNSFDRNERGIFSNSSATVVINNIISNSPGYGILGQFKRRDYNNTWNNGTDNTPGPNGILLQPMYVDADNNDFRLSPLSPCIDSGDPDPQYDDPDGTRNDIGYIHFSNSPPSAPLLVSPALDETVTNTAPTFIWRAAQDDPGDVVTYTLFIAVDSLLNFTKEFDSLIDTTLALTDSLPFKGILWWKVQATDLRGASSGSETRRFATLFPGDVNGSGGVDIVDIIFLSNMIFSNGPPPDPLFLGDVDRSCSINVADLTYLIKRIFAAGPAPLIGCAE